MCRPEKSRIHPFTPSAAVVDFHQLGEAGSIVRILSLKLFEGVFGRD